MVSGEKPEKPLNIHDYMAIARRRKWHILLPLVLSLIIAFGVYKYLPKVYKANTLILVQSQEVSSTYVRSTITASVTEQLNTLSQEILSRTRLEMIISEFNLFSDIRNRVPWETVLEKMRKAIEVNIHSRPQGSRMQNAFSISFEGEDPGKVMMVTNRLTSSLIEDHLKIRELQAERTSEFLGKELTLVEKQLKKKEEDIKNVKEKYMGELPQQMDANVRTMERLQQQLQTTSERVKAAEDRSILFQNQIEELKRSQRVDQRNMVSDPVIESIPADQAPRDPLFVQWNNLKRELISAQSKYTENHPDVIDLKSKIAKMEPKILELLKKQEIIEETTRKERQARLERDSAERAALPMRDLTTERLLRQYSEQNSQALLEAKRLKEEQKNLREEISSYKQKIDNTPRREQELTLLTRDYDLLKSNYQSLMEKKSQADMAESLEKGQKGEQYKVLDRARLPEKPIRPKLDQILLIGGFIGLIAGFGLAWFKESLDQSFHSEPDVEEYLGIPVLASIPNLKDEKT